MNMSDSLNEFASSYKFGYIDADISNQIEIPKDIKDLFTATLAQKLRMLPMKVDVDDEGDRKLTILTSNKDAFRYQTELLEIASDVADSINFFFIKEDKLLDAISNNYGITFEDESFSSDEFEVISKSGDETEDDDTNLDIDSLSNASSPIVALVNTIIKTAVTMRASDIHMEPEESGMLVKYRIDGVLIPQRQFNISEKNKKAVIARLKIMSELDVSKKKDTQDGQMKLKINDVEVDFRVSLLPVINGEKAVLRILDKTTSLLDLDTLGFTHEDILTMNNIINSPTGMILITGPTGSGKSTTLYSFLNRLDSTAKNITTIENPVEYQLKGLNQVQIDDKHITFAGALREILRQDPNVVMVGEIRDKETAENAVQAAQTGHLVFSTLHTNDAISVISRLKRLGVMPDDITQSLLCVMAQRLVRRICPNCTETYIPDFEKYGIREKDIETISEPSEAEKKRGKNKHTFIHGKGCDECNNTGYKGRITVYEYYVMDDDIRNIIEQGKTVYEVKQFLIEEKGYKTMWQKGLELVRQNVTTIEEITREVKR